MLKFDSIIKSINNLQISLENNLDIIKPAINVISSFDEIKPDILKIRYNVNKKKIINYLNEFQKTNKESISVLISQSIYNSFFIDKLFDIIINLIDFIKPSVFSIQNYADSSLLIETNNFDISKIDKIKDKLLFFDFFIKENKIIISNIGSLEKFLIVENNFGKVCLPFTNIDEKNYLDNKIILYIYNEHINLDYKIIREIKSFRQIADSLVNYDFFNGVIIANNDEIIPVLSLNYLYYNKQWILK